MKISFSSFLFFSTSGFFLFEKYLLPYLGFFVCFVSCCVCEQKSTYVYFLVATTLKIKRVCAIKVNEQNYLFIGHVFNESYIWFIDQKTLIIDWRISENQFLAFILSKQGRVWRRRKKKLISLVIKNCSSQ